jgi:uncharacterized protein YcfJ
MTTPRTPTASCLRTGLVFACAIVIITRANYTEQDMTGPAETRLSELTVAQQMTPPQVLSDLMRGLETLNRPCNAQQIGTVVGGILGAIVGSRIADKHPGKGAVGGGAAGAALGSIIGRNIEQQMPKCPVENQAVPKSPQRAISA